MLQVDLPILPSLNKVYEIDWYFAGDKLSDTGKTAERFAIENNINIHYIEYREFIFNPKLYFTQKNNILELVKKDYDLYYFDISTFPWLLFSIKKYITKEKVVIAMHHGKPHKGMRFKFLYYPFLKYLNRQDFYLQYFSESQSEGFKGKDVKKKFVIPLALTSFGELKEVDNLEGKINFTVFGNIIPSKNVQLIIQAANRLWNEFPKKFVVNIVGHCKNWNKEYQPIIEQPEAFNLDIRRISESEIPHLFSKTHYLVLPYSSVTQSGPLRIAYNYNVPVIASDLDGFKESIKENITGFMFKNNNVYSLYDTLKKVILNHPSIYHNIKITQRDYVSENYSTKSICEKYNQMFNSILKTNENN